MHPHPRRLARDQHPRGGVKPHHRARVVLGVGGGEPPGAKPTGTDIGGEVAHASTTPASRMPASALTSEPSRSMPRVRSCRTVTQYPSHVAATAEKLTQKSVASPTMVKSSMPRVCK